MTKIPHTKVNRNVPLVLKRKIWARPCVICGTTYRIRIDHITPLTLGGTSEESNLQPLCWLCNHKKGNRLSNDQLREWYLANKKAHHERVERTQSMFPEYA